MKPAPHLLGSAIGVLGLVLLSFGGLVATVSGTRAARDPSQGVAVVFAPWTPSATVLTRAVDAGGRFVRFGGLSFVAIIVPDRTDYAARAGAAGAWLIVDPMALAACLSLAQSKGIAK